MNAVKCLLVASLLLLLGIGCASIQVRSDFDDQADFSQYQTFRVVDRPTMKSAARGNPMLDRKIAQALKEELRAKGLREVTQGPPDLLVGFHSDVKNRVSVSEQWYPYRWRGPRHTMTVNSYKQRTLIIDMIDRVENAVVWRGWATSAFKSPDEAEETVRKAVAKVLKDYPPKTK